MNWLFLVPARGGSKGLPGKNLKLVGGIPLVGRAARLARSALRVLGEPGRVVCSTDDDAIAAAAHAWGADVPFRRPAALAADDTPSVAVVRHALEAVGDAVDVVVLLQPTSPLTDVADVLGATHLFRETGHAVVTVSECEHPVEWSFWLGREGQLIPVLERNPPHQRQGMRRAVRLNGAVHVASAAELWNAVDFLTDETRGYAMPTARSVDIDCEPDLRLAEATLAGREVSPVRLGERLVGPGQPCFVIAEAGVNHNGKLEFAERLVDAAAEAGADAVKFQTYVTERICAPEAPKAAYQERHTGVGSQFAMLKALELPYAWHAPLKRRAEERGLVFLSTPDDIESAQFLCSLDVSAIKVGSAELTNLPFLEQLALLKRPLIVSTGMATMREVANAIDVIEGAGGGPVVLLHCVSSYPAPDDELNLSCLASLRLAFGRPVGLSDHTPDQAAAVASVGFGLAVLEKHLTLDRSLPGPDQSMSCEPTEFRALVRSLRRAESMIGTGLKAVTASELETVAAVRRTLLYARPLGVGATLRPGDLVALRAGDGGLGPEQALQLVGRCLRRAVPSGAAVSEADFA